MTQSGALAFLESKMRTFSLFELRDYPLPSKTDHSTEVKKGIKQCMFDVLQLCE